MPKFFPFLPEGKSQCFIEKKKRERKIVKSKKGKIFTLCFFQDYESFKLIIFCYLKRVKYKLRRETFEKGVRN